jgi:hypothetical protein
MLVMFARGVEAVMGAWAWSWAWSWAWAWVVGGPFPIVAAARLVIAAFAISECWD